MVEAAVFEDYLADMVENEAWSSRTKQEQQQQQQHYEPIPSDKKELYSHILEEINRRILSQSFFLTVPWSWLIFFGLTEKGIRS